MSISVFSSRESSWLDDAMSALKDDGVCVVDHVLDDAFVARSAEGLYRVRDQILDEIGPERLARAGEIGVLRLMQAYDPHFISYLEIPQALALIDAVLTDTAVQHTQNGFIMPPWEAEPPPEVFQTSFHQDFPRYFNGCVMSLNLYFPLSDFRPESGATLVVPNSHQRAARPTEEDIRTRALPVECAPGSMFVFDSTLWHAAGTNRSGEDRLSINHQFTRSYLKQQLDYPRALGWDNKERYSPRTQQLLGFYTRVPASLDDYYRPSKQRLYRGGQG